MTFDILKADFCSGGSFFNYRQPATKREDTRALKKKRKIILSVITKMSGNKSDELLVAQRRSSFHSSVEVVA